MTTAKGLSSGYLPIGASLVTDEVAQVIEENGEFAHGYTYSDHPVSCAVALENLRILQQEKIIERLQNNIAPYLQQKWLRLEAHPLVGEARICGMMGAIELTPDKIARAPFSGEKGEVTAITRTDPAHERDHHAVGEAEIGFQYLDIILVLWFFLLLCCSGSDLALLQLFTPQGCSHHRVEKAIFWVPSMAMG